MRRSAFLFVCLVLASTSCASADTFCFNAALLAKVRSELSSSAVVHTKSEGVADVCRKRMHFLSEMVGAKREKSVAQAINVYMQSTHLHARDFEIVQLRRSENFDQLAQNTRAISRAYATILAEVGTPSGDTKKGKKAKAAAESAKSVSASVPSEEKLSGARPNRQNMTSRGRFNRK